MVRSGLRRYCDDEFASTNKLCLLSTILPKIGCICARLAVHFKHQQEDAARPSRSTSPGSCTIPLQGSLRGNRSVPMYRERWALRPLTVARTHGQFVTVQRNNNGRPLRGEKNVSGCQMYLGKSSPMGARKSSCYISHAFVHQPNRRIMHGLFAENQTVHGRGVPSLSQRDFLRGGYLL
jgi:hypothetical protein